MDKNVAQGHGFVMPIISRPSPNFNEREQDIRYIMLHYTDQQNVDETLTILCDPERAVSAHYVVDYDGTVYQLVDESKRAWHAGIGSWQGVTTMNGASIGIEIENPGHSHGHKPFTEEQILAVMELCKAAIGRHNIDARNVIGHSDYAPGRKEDPGHLFPWRRLHEEWGLGIWPKAVPAVVLNAPEAQTMLSRIGYDVSNFPAALLAFQRHFVPADMGQGLTPATCAAIMGLV